MPTQTKTVTLLHAQDPRSILEALRNAQRFLQEHTGLFDGQGPLEQVYALILQLMSSLLIAKDANALAADVQSLLSVLADLAVPTSTTSSHSTNELAKVQTEKIALDAQLQDLREEARTHDAAYHVVRGQAEARQKRIEELERELQQAKDRGAAGTDAVRASVKAELAEATRTLQQARRENERLHAEIESERAKATVQYKSLERSTTTTEAALRKAEAEAEALRRTVKDQEERRREDVDATIVNVREALQVALALVTKHPPTSASPNEEIAKIKGELKRRGAYFDQLNILTSTASAEIETLDGEIVALSAQRDLATGFEKVELRRQLVNKEGARTLLQDRVTALIRTRDEQSRVINALKTLLTSHERVAQGLPADVGAPLPALPT